MDTRIAKVYGIPLIAIGTLLLWIDVVIMSFGSEIIKVQINPVKMSVEYLDNLVALNTTIGSVITSHFFIVLAIGSGIAFFFALANILTASREEKNFLPLYIAGGLSLLFWLIHAFCIGKYFIIANWEHHSYIRYYSKKFICVEFLFLTLFCVVSTCVLFLLPSGRARAFRKFLMYGLSSVALLCLADILLFGLLNVVFHKESISVFPFLSFIAVCLIGPGSYLLLATPGVLMALQKIDGALHLSSFFGPLVYKFDRTADMVSAPAGAERTVAEASEIEKMSRTPAAGSRPASLDPSLMKLQIEILDKKQGTAETKGTPEVPVIPRAPAVEVSPRLEPLRADPPAASPIKSGTLIAVLAIGLFCMLITVSLMAWYFTMGPGKMALTAPSPSSSPESADTPTPKPTTATAFTPKPTPRKSFSSVTAGVGQSSPSPMASVKIRILPESDISYTDISESTFRLQIIGLARMGIFNKVTGEFRPDEPISRSEYIRWLVRTNNVFFPTETGNFIKVAQSGDSTFRDVTPENPDWKWIQGMANAGYIIGYDEVNFKPEKEISREEMMAIRCGLEYNITLKDIERIEKNLAIYKKDLEERFNDASKIERKYVAAYFKDMDSSFLIFRSAFGTTRILLPQKKLTREEAVSTMWTIRGEKGDKVLNR
ncbi:MAG: S-layer homology domain-containing protein [Candidatus Xenobiia bacterium LiM19]